MRSVRSRLLVWLVLGQAAILVVMNAVIWHFGSKIIRDGFDEHLATDVRAIGTLLSQAGPDLELEFSDELMPQYLPGASPAYFEVWVAGSGVLERSLSLRSQGAVDGGGLIDLPRRGGTVMAPDAWDLELPHGVSGRAVGITFPIHEYASVNAEGKSAPRANATIVTAIDRAPLDAQLNKLGIGLATLDVALILVSALLLFMGVDLGLKPMLSLAKDLETASTSEEALELSWAEVPREMKPVKDALLRLLERVDEAFQREKRLGGNIAHELRTPIAELRAAADVALMKSNSRSALEDAVRTSRAIAEEMETVVHAILRIWRARSGGARERLCIVDPFQVLDSCVAGLASVARDRRIAVRVSGDRALQVLAPSHMLGLALDNLIRNAVEHAVEGTEVECSVEAVAGRVQVQVKNQQFGLSEADGPFVREPFWSRELNVRQSGNTGLGLALVDALGEACGFDLDVQIRGGETLAEGAQAPGTFTATLCVDLATESALDSLAS
ncbi:Sensor kinase CusS [Planctomycetes bacterium Poly30]|uniref:histidine kinase n=1 Tax=Saltatorellus ferox TaxID=2528018 RepID=A0A518EZV0_9BACT|nr:Sensor kinase CusS [Planctomycetes bacterium Poly30]